MKVGILTESFIDLCGAIDFIKQMIISMAYVSYYNDMTIYVLIPDNGDYKNYKGFKRFISKLKYNSTYKSGYLISSSDDKFPEITNVNFVRYSSDIKSVVDSIGIEFLLPHMRKEFYNWDIPTMGYLYDCQHKYYPEFFTEDDIYNRNKFFSEMIQGNVMVNAMSVKNDLIKFYNANPDNIFVLPYSPKLPVTFFKDNSWKIKKYNLSKKYFLSSNQFWVHKDHPTLFMAFAKFIKNEKYKDFELICTGTMDDSRRPTYIQELKNLIKSLGIENNVRLLGLIPKFEQIEIMKRASAVIQTTLFEGGPGGGSVWDAISLQVPSIVSDITTNLEIEDDSVIFFKSKDLDDLVMKMNFVLEKDSHSYSEEELISRSRDNMLKLGNSITQFIKIQCSK